jgi:hypothetical protein
MSALQGSVFLPCVRRTRDGPVGKNLRELSRGETLLELRGHWSVPCLQQRVAVDVVSSAARGGHPSSS